MITERPSKSHGIRYLVRVDFDGRKTTVGTFRTEREAKKAEREARNQIDRGTFEPKIRGHVTPKPEATRIPNVADALAVWLESKRNTLLPNTVTIYQSAIRLHLNSAIGDRDIRDLTPDDLQRQVNDWRDAGMGARLLGRCVVLLKSALDRQVRNGVIPHNPAIGIEKPSARTRKPMMIWDGAQIDAFLSEAMQDDRYAPFWALTLLEGLRRGEALGLRWRDLHWNADETGCVATITQTLVADLANGGAALIQDRAKTKSSRRSVQLTPTTIAILKTHRDHQRSERLRLADLWGVHDLIVTTGIGTPVTPSTIKRNQRALMKAAGVPSITTHGLRHQAATIMLRAGVSPALVAQKLGHSDISTTVDLYGHLTVSDQTAANAAIEAAIRKIS
jgi:integrase